MITFDTNSFIYDSDAPEAGGVRFSEFVNLPGVHLIGKLIVISNPEKVNIRFDSFEHPISEVVIRDGRTRYSVNIEVLSNKVCDVRCFRQIS